MLIPVPVKALAEFVHRRGDLYPPLGGRVSPEEGIAAQRRAQQNRSASYQREVPVAAEFDCGPLSIALSGRADGCDLECDPPLVEELKTTRAEPHAAERLVGSAHWAQLRLYAALLARLHPGHARWQLRLLYCHPHEPVATPFEELTTAEALEQFLQESVACYGAWLAEQATYEAARNQRLAQLAFPYAGFRPHQRALAARVFQSFRDAEHLLLEAPTGSGKTMGVLYPALKALASGHARRLFFLTSRGTGARAARMACADVEAVGAGLRVLELIAKEKACPVPGMPCGEGCPYARDYYSRVRPALRELLSAGTMLPDRVQAVAETHQVCPFELSLDAALWSDVIIGDYNYLLDPVVRLQRFADDAGLGVLIDEAHQLADRSRDMLSLALERRMVLAALAEQAPAALLTRLRGVDRALMTLGRSLEQGVEVVIEPPAALLRAIERTMATLAEVDVDLNLLPATRVLLFELARWVRSSAWVDADGYRYLAEVQQGGGRREIVIRLACLDPAPYLTRVLSGYGPHVRFSGTLSPLDLHQRLHGSAGGAAERVASPFSPAQLATLVVTDVPVYYRQRERSLPRLAALIGEIAACRAGSYLVAVPSFEYLARLAAALAERCPDLALLSQTPGMDEAARTAFLEAFSADGRTRVGLIVLGGVFAESVDFAHAPLAGVVCVGVGLPPVSTLRSELAGFYDRNWGAGAGEAVAYQQPAMTKVLQMAGRLLRAPEDRGVLCLVDDRFMRPEFQRFFPEHWQPERVRSADVAGKLRNFWQRLPALPRLETSTDNLAT